MLSSDVRFLFQKIISAVGDRYFVVRDFFHIDAAHHLLVGRNSTAARSAALVLVAIKR